MQYFYGLDSYGAREAIAELATYEKAQVRWVDSEQLERASVRDMVGQSRGFFGKDLVVVRDPADLPRSLQEGLAAYIEEEGKVASWVAWDKKVPDKRAKLWRALVPHAREFPAWEAVQLAKWLGERALALGGGIEKPAAEMLVARLGVDRWRLENELKRLLLMAEVMALNPFVTQALVEQEVAVAEQSQIFALLDALGRGEKEAAVRSVQALLQAGNTEFYILSMLGYQWRTLMLVRAGLDENTPASVIARDGKIHPYVVEKNLPMARRLPYARWRDGLTRILATDFAIKQGKVDPRTGLLMLILTLTTSG